MGYVAMLIIVAFIACAVFIIRKKSQDSHGSVTGSPSGPPRSPQKPPEQQ